MIDTPQTWRNIGTLASSSGVGSFFSRIASNIRYKLLLFHSMNIMSFEEKKKQRERLKCWTGFRMTLFLQVLFAHVLVPIISGLEWIILTNLETQNVTIELIHIYWQINLLCVCRHEYYWLNSVSEYSGPLAIMCSYSSVSDFTTLLLNCVNSKHWWYVYSQTHYVY